MRSIKPACASVQPADSERGVSVAKNGPRRAVSGALPHRAGRVRLGVERRQLRRVLAERAHHQRPARRDQTADKAAVRAQCFERGRRAERRDQQMFAGKRRVRADHAGPAVAAERLRRGVAVGHAALLRAGADRRERQLRPARVEQCRNPRGDAFARDVRQPCAAGRRQARPVRLIGAAMRAWAARRPRAACRPPAPAPT